MAATERVVVLMSRAEKAALEHKAVASGSASMGDFMRRAAAAYELGSEQEAAELAAILPVFWASHEQTLRTLDRTERKLDETLADLEGVRGK